jgi:hypothetical protein
MIEGKISSMLIQRCECAAKHIWIGTSPAQDKRQHGARTLDRRRKFRLSKCRVLAPCRSPQPVINNHLDKRQPARRVA